MLSKYTITENTIELAKSEMNLFLKTYIEVFGITNNVPNVHELSHIIESVKNSGPLWCNSTFWFESLNYRLKRMVRSSLRPDLQVVHRFFEIQNAPNHDYSVKSEKLKEKLKEYKLTKYFGSKANIKFKEKKLSYDYTLLAGITTSLCAKRIWIKGEVFETSQYSKKFKASNCYIKERNGYYQIEEIVKVDKQVKFICKILVVKKDFNVYK